MFAEYVIVNVNVIVNWILLSHAVERGVTAGSKEGCEKYTPHFIPSGVNRFTRALHVTTCLAQAVLLYPTIGCVLTKKDKNNIIALIGG